MKVYSRIYMVEDHFGTRRFASCEEPADIIQMTGLENREGKKVYFESEAYHLENWCEENDLKYKVVEKVYDFDELWDEE